MLVWNPEGADDDVWARLREHFTDEQIIELGSFVCLTYGQQRVIKTWRVGHGEFLPGTAGGLAPEEAKAEASLAMPSPGRAGSARASVGNDRSTRRKNERRP
jgi:hypothetical protein